MEKKENYIFFVSYMLFYAIRPHNHRLFDIYKANKRKRY